MIPDPASDLLEIVALIGCGVAFASVACATLHYIFRRK